MKNYSLLILIFVLILSQSCTKEEIIETEQTVAEVQNEKSNFQLESFTIDEIPTLKSYLNDYTSKSGIQWSSKTDGENTYLDKSNILVVTDSVGNKTYSVLMYVPETPLNVFYNLVIKQNTEGDNTKVVLRYETDKDYFEQYISQDRRKTPFIGIIESYKLSDFNLQSLETLKSGTKKPCDQATANSSQGTSSSSGSGGGGGNNGRSGSYTSYSTATIGSASGNVRVKNGYVEVGRGHFGQPDGGGDHQKSFSFKGNDCPKVKTLIPINEKEDIFIIPSCTSFEYADGVSNGIKAKIAGVSNIHNFFAAGGFNSDGSPYYHSVELNISKGYFVMYGNRTNGTAANQTAQALRTANIATKAWFLKNPKASSTSLSYEWNNNIKKAMKLIGGEFTTTPSFNIKSPSPYEETFAWMKNDCS